MNFVYDFDLQLLSLTFDATTGLLKSMVDLRTNLTTALKQSYLWYNSSFEPRHTIDYPTYMQPSGAYIFRPNSSDAFKVTNGPVTISVVKVTIENSLT